jgi:RNA polymerase sigma-70 factor (ECF subfamily)
MINENHWTEHRAALYRQATFLARNAADANDLVQDTFVRAWRFRDQLQNPAGALPWMRAILQRLFITRYNRAHQRGEYETLPLLPLADQMMHDAEKSLEQQTVLRLEAEVARQIIAALPKRSQECLILSDIDGLGDREIAARLGVTVATVKSRLHRARHQVRFALQSQGWDS